MLKRLLRFCFKLGLFATIVGILVAIPWLAWLNAQVTERFSGQRWQLPAQVFARPMELYPGALLERVSLVEEVERLGYRPVRNPVSPGQFSASRNVVEVHTRPFQFWDGLQASQRLRISLRDGTVEGLTSDLAGGAIAVARLDPALIGSIYPSHGEDRVLVRLDTVPRLLSEGLVAVEDKRFYSHFGVDPRGLARAMAANLKARRWVQGGSTITQQLVKNYFLDSGRNLVRKINEAAMAVLLEFHYPKTEILEAYLNEIYLGQDGPRAVHGFGLGSYFYFRKPLEELDVHELALLVGIIKGPSYYSPRRHPERAKARRAVVIGLWERQGLITPEVAEQARNAGLSVVERGSRGTTQYPDFVELVRQQLKRDYEEDDLTSEGLRIFTTLDPGVQQAAEAAVNSTLPNLEKSHQLEPDSLQAAMIVATPNNGEVKAVVGGRSSRASGFNRALEAQRAVGSLIKPFVYLTAVQPEHGYHLASPLPDEPLSLQMPNGSIWEPQNYDEEFSGEMPLWKALAESVNLPAVHVGLDIGVEHVVQTLNRHGLKRNVPAYPSLLLGATNLSPFEVATIFQPLASDGFVTPLNSIREVSKADGTPLRRYPLAVERASSPQTTYLVARAMQETVRTGTARYLGATQPSLQFAGKTGTTNDYRDSWFAGFGGDLVGVTWVGKDDNTATGLTGSSGALRVWSATLAKLRPQPLRLTAPGGVVELAVIDGQPLLADSRCPYQISLPFLRSNAPDTWANCAARRGRFELPPEHPVEEPEEKSVFDWFKGIFD